MRSGGDSRENIYSDLLVALLCIPRSKLSASETNETFLGRPEVDRNRGPCCVAKQDPARSAGCGNPTRNTHGTGAEIDDTNLACGDGMPIASRMNPLPL